MKSLLIFIKKYIVYELRDFTHVIQPKVSTITYSHNTTRYQGSKLWKTLPNKVEMSNVLSSFKNATQKWSGPECHCGYFVQCTLFKSLYIYHNWFFKVHNHISKKLF